MRHLVFRARLRLESWLWSGPRRARLAKHLPLAICDIEAEWLKRKLRDPEWLSSLDWMETRRATNVVITACHVGPQTSSSGVTIHRMFPEG